MIGLLVGLLLLFWIIGRTRGLVGGLTGGLLGALVLVGIARTVRDGELGSMYTPGDLASSAVAVAVVAAVLALVAPNGTAFAAFGWGVGALLAAIAAPATGQATYVLPLTVHVLAAAAVLAVARARRKLAAGARSAGHRPPPGKRRSGAWSA